MATAEELQTQLAKVEAEMLRPERVRFGDRETQSRSYDDLAKERARLLGEIAAVSATQPPRMFHVYAGGKGT